MDNPAQLNKQPNKGTRTRPLLMAFGSIVVLIAGTVGIYIWFLQQNTCEVQFVKEASNLLTGQLNRYDHVYQFATSASPDSIGYPVTTLQQILSDTKAVEVPGCLRTARNELTSYMGTVIRAFLAYGAGEPDTAIRQLLIQSDEHYGNFFTELEAVSACAPVCFPWD